MSFGTLSFQSTQHVFRDRREAGRLLAPLLQAFSGRDDVVVLALPRGGVPVAYEVALTLGAPLDAFTVRKLGVPGHEEFAMGAIASGGAYVLKEDIIETLHVTHDEIVRVAKNERLELERRERLYRDHRAFPKLEGNIVILVDDGLATGTSMLVAVDALRRKRPERVIVAAPVASADAWSLLRKHADDVICYVIAEHFGSVGSWYRDFTQVRDSEVRSLLNQSAGQRP